MPIAEVNGTTIYYKEHGRGEPILLIMGLATQMVAWPPAMIDALVAQGYRVIPFDNRDIGLSAKTQGPAPHLKDVLRGAAAPRLARADYSLADMADDAAGLLGHLGIERAHVVGVSMGGMIAQEFAIRHPERVATLASIMSNTGNKRHGRPAPSFMNEFVRSFLAPRPRTREEAVTAGLAAWRAICGPHFDEGGMRAMIELSIERDADPVGQVRQMLAILAAPDRTARLRRLDLPTVVIHGLLDRLVTPSGGIATARAVPGSRLLMFPDMAHDLPAPRIGEIVEAIVANARRAPVAA